LRSLTDDEAAAADSEAAVAEAPLDETADKDFGAAARIRSDLHSGTPAALAGGSGFAKLLQYLWKHVTARGVLSVGKEGGPALPRAPVSLP